MLKRVNFVIEPQAARPQKVIQQWNGDVYEFDTQQVAFAALREVLQTTLSANPFAAFIDGFLIPHTNWLTWIGDGPGIGKEMRRGFSAIFGRFFARAYLMDCHNFVWFVPLDGPQYQVSRRLRVRSPRRRGDLPDWLCAGRGHLALAEAKGSRSSGSFRSLRRPQPIKQAVKQLEACKVSVWDRSSQIWVDRRLKGWAVLNQWAFQTRARDPFLYVVDPETDGKSLSRDEIPGLVREVAREHVASLFRGMRIIHLASEISLIARFDESLSYLSTESVSPITVVVPDLKAEATGRFFHAPLGSMLSILGDDIFVGVQNDVIEDLQIDSDASPRTQEPIAMTDQGIFRGADGLILARRGAVELRSAALQA